MITNKYSWVFLVAFLVVLTITIWAGIGSYNSGIEGGKVMGIFNMILGGAWTLHTYLKNKDK